MAESALSIGYPEIAQDVSEFLGYNPTIANLGTDELRHVQRACDSGYRMFVNAVDPRTSRGYRWSFLDSVATITTVADDNDYDLPDDYAHHRGPVVFPSDEPYSPVTITSEYAIHEGNSRNDSSGIPKVAAIRAKASDGTSGQRFEILFYPTPDSVWAMKLPYAIIPSVRLRSGTPYPLGGMNHAETILYACLAAAELQKDDDRGPRWETFKELLIASIDMDRRGRPDNIGYNGDGVRHPLEYPYDFDHSIVINGTNSTEL